jgi:hypothetical protein
MFHRVFLRLVIFKTTIIITMKRIFLLTTLLIGFSFLALSQELSPKEKAEGLAKNEFSKSKRKKEEKDGVVKEKIRVVESTPVINTNLSFYHGNYVYNDLKYKLEIRSDEQNHVMATLTIADGQPIRLKNVTISDAYFTAVKPNADGTEEFWEGAFINKNDNGTTDFGLGIKLSRPIPLTEGLQITRLFFKKVSP